MSEDRERAYGEKLASLIVVDERPGFREELRAHLLAQVGSATRERRQGIGWLATLRPFAVAAAVVALVVGGGGYAAASSLPGDPAFALKRAAEEVVFTLALDDGTRAERLVGQTDARLGEVRRAALGSPAFEAGLDEYAATVARLTAVLDRLRSAPASSRRDAALALAATALREHGDVLGALRQLVPAEASRGLDRAIEAQRGAQERAPAAPPGLAPGQTARPGTPPGAPPTRPPTPASPGRGAPSALPAAPRAP